MTIKVTLVSFFRNSEKYLDRYFNQVFALEKVLEAHGITLHLLLGYGDSTDITEEYLKEQSLSDWDMELVDVSHGGPEFGSVVDAVRFKQLAGIGNKLWPLIPTDSNYVIFVESDLVWRVETLASLLDSVEGLRSVSSYPTAPILLAPMIIASNGLFYDSWAFRALNRHFRSSPRIHSIFRSPDKYLEVDSVGSCFVLDYELAKQLYWPEEDVVVGLCREAKKLGAKIFVDRSLEVYHP